MQHFAEFYHVGTTGTVIPACGSDAHLPIDGRFGLVRAKYAAIRYMEQIDRQRTYCGFALYRTSNQRTGNEKPYYTFGRIS